MKVKRARQENLELDFWKFTCEVIKKCTGEILKVGDRSSKPWSLKVANVFEEKWGLIFKRLVRSKKCDHKNPINLKPIQNLNFLPLTPTYLWSRSKISRLCPLFKDRPQTVSLIKIRSQSTFTITYSYSRLSKRGHALLTITTTHF